MTPLKLARMKSRGEVQWKQAVHLLEASILHQKTERVKELDLCDTNGDGVITEEERKCRELSLNLLRLVSQLTQYFELVRPSIMQVDIDDDGQLTDDEICSFYAMLTGKRQQSSSSFLSEAFAHITVGLSRHTVEDSDVVRFGFLPIG